MRLFYFALSLPVFFISLILFSLSKNFRHEYRLVQSKITKHPNTSFDNLLTAVLILAEDHRYETHFGFDPIAISRALLRIIVYNKLEGASTIEQQFVRTVTGRYSVSIARKTREIITATLISITNNKRDIAHSYLSVAYLGSCINKDNLASLTFQSGGAQYSEDLINSASIVALLKRPKPARPNELWDRRHKARVAHIVEKYVTLKSFPTKRHRRAAVAYNA